jgi:hypothetical protein
MKIGKNEMNNFACKVANEFEDTLEIVGEYEEENDFVCAMSSKMWEKLDSPHYVDNDGVEECDGKMFVHYLIISEITHQISCHYELHYK